MEYSFKEFTIQNLVDLIDQNRIDLNPSYQRNFIWSPNDQQALVDTILLNYPLPNFFVWDRKDGNFEMVDGQQRSKTIYRFIKGMITSSKESGSVAFEKTDKNSIWNYKLPFVVIDKLSEKDSLKEFYVLINKKGVHLNTAEVNKSEFHDTLFLKLANEVLEEQDLIDLDLFSDLSSKRMNDRAFIEELLGYLKLGIKDKKQPVKSLYDSDITKEEYGLLKKQFNLVIGIIATFNKIKPIKHTRYKQKSDFYTMFSFVNENQSLAQKTLKHQYRILLVLDGVDSDGRQFIRPTNDECQSLKEYANNCVSQSNSKNARDNRLHFFNAVLKNTSLAPNDTLVDVLTYLGNVYDDENVKLVEVGDFRLLDIAALNHV